MGTREDAPETETRADEFIGAFRVAIGGHERAAVRRIILYVILGVLLGVAFVLPLAVIPASAVLLLLATTDQLV